MARIKNPTILGAGGGNAKPEETKTIALDMSGGDMVIVPTSGSVLTQVTVPKPSTLVSENIKEGVSIGGVPGSLVVSDEHPTLYTPSISRSSNTLNITNPASNGNFVTGYKIYDNGTLIATQNTTTYDLSSLSVGSHSITVIAYGTNFNDSQASSAIAFNVYGVSNVLANLTNSNAASTVFEGDDYSCVLSPAAGYYLPDTINITNGGNAAQYTYDNTTGDVAISYVQINGNIVITATADTEPKLATPTISLSDSIISWSAIANATSYKVYYNGSVVDTVSTTSCDLSTVFSQDGTYVVSIVASASGYRDSKASNTVSYEKVSVQKIYGVSGLYQSSPALTRTDDAVNMTAVVNSSTGLVSSDFENVFPWSEATVETINGNKFLRLPNMWFRVGVDSSNRITDVAVSKAQGSTGNWYKVDSFYYGCYGGSVSNSKLASVSGVERQHTKTRAEFRSYASANGSGYHQLDLYHNTVMKFLWLIEWATKDSASIMPGKTSATGTSACNTGGTDSLSTPSGFNTTTKQMRWHYIEDFVGNYMEFVDGAFGSGSTYYGTADPTKFGDSATGMNTLAYSYPSNASSSNRCVSALGWDDNNPFLVQPKAQTGTDYTKHFCDANASSNNAVLSVGAYWNYASAYCGVFCFVRNADSYSINGVGGRLLYKP